MANNIFNISVQTRQNVETADNSRRREFSNIIRNLFKSFAEGGTKGAAGQTYSSLSARDAATSYAEQFIVSDTQAYGTATITLVSVGAGNCIAINGVVFRAVSGTPVVANGEFKQGVTDTADATSLVAAISGSTDARITGLMTATSALGVVTLTPVLAGTAPNCFTIETLGILATGTVTCSSTSGTLTTTINGVAVTATAGATDTLSATAIVTAIAASSNTLVANHVRANSAAGVVTIYARYGGKQGNTITLASSGTGVTASGARLTGGAVSQHWGAQATGTVTIASGSGSIVATINGVASTITWATSDTNSATLLAAAINSNTDALVRELVTATSSAGVVTITAVRGGLHGNTITLAASGTGATASAARLASGAVPTQVAAGSATTAFTFPGARFASGSQSAPVTFSL